MKKFVTLLVVLGSLGGLFYLVGLILPRVHSTTSRASFVSKPDEIFDVLVDIANWEYWYPGLENVDQLPDRSGKALYELTGQDGERRLLELASMDRPMRFQAFLFTGDQRETLRCDIKWYGEGSVVRVTLQGDTKEPWRRALRLFQDEHTSLGSFLLELGRRVGEDVEPEDL